MGPPGHGRDLAQPLSPYEVLQLRSKPGSGDQPRPGIKGARIETGSGRST